MLTGHKGSLGHLEMPSQKKVSEQSSGTARSLVCGLDKECKDTVANLIAAASQAIQDTSNTSNVGKSRRPCESAIMAGDSSGKTFMAIWRQLSAPPKEGKKCLCEISIWHSCRVPRIPKCCQWNPQGGFPKSGSCILPCPLGLAAGTMHVYTREPYGNEKYGKSHTCGIKWHLLNEGQGSALGSACPALSAPPCSWEELSGMLFFRGIWVERSLLCTTNKIHIFSLIFSPYTHFNGPQVTNTCFLSLINK